MQRARSHRSRIRPSLVVGALLTAVALGTVAVPAFATATREVRRRQPTCLTTEPVGPVTETESDTTRSSASAAATGGVSTQSVAVEVPPGRLYLEPPTLSLRVPAGASHVELPEILVADLREAAAGWQLSATVMRGPDQVRLLPGRIRHVAGHPRVDRATPLDAAVGACVVVAEGRGFGSSFIGGSLLVPRSAESVTVDISLELRPIAS